MNEKDKQLFLELYQLMLSDTEVHPKELEMLYQIGQAKGVSEQEIQQAIFSPVRLATSQSLSDDDKIEYLYNLAQMAWADGVIDDRETESLHNTCKRLGFEEEYVEEITGFMLEQVKAEKSFEEVLTTIKNL
jgi:DnaJ-domain-containing protein 1